MGSRRRRPKSKVGIRAKRMHRRENRAGWETSKISRARQKPVRRCEEGDEKNRKLPPFTAPYLG